MSWVFVVALITRSSVSYPVPVSKPVLSVVGAMLVLGKPFQLLCHSDSGTLPISYTLYGPDRMPEVKVVSSPGEQAIFNTSAIVKSSDISRLLCHAKNTNNKPPMIGSGQQLLASTKIIGALDADDKVFNPSMHR